MNPNAYEVRLRAVLEQRSGEAIREISQSAPLFSELAIHYPVVGSRIAWSKVPGAIVRSTQGGIDEPVKFAAFFDEMVSKFELQSDVIYLGDSAIDFGLEGSLSSIRSVLVELLKIPQSHYFIGARFQWCMSFTFEGDMAFGIRPPVVRNDSS